MRFAPVIAEAHTAAVGANAARGASMAVAVFLPAKGSELEMGRRCTLTVYPTGPTSLL